MGVTSRQLCFVPFVLLAVNILLHSSVSAATCYNLLGSRYGDSSGVVQCNSSATGQTSSHSTCCHGDNGDACLSSGLCLNTIAYVSGHMLWSTGCTDPTLKDSSCPQVCVGSSYGTLGNYNLRSCDVNGTSNTWCCGNSTDDTEPIETCCEKSFKLPKEIGSVAFQLSGDANAAVTQATTAISSSTASATTSTSSSAAAAATTTCAADSQASDDNDAGYITGIAVLSALLIGSLIALGVLGCYTKQLRRRVEGLPQDPSHAPQQSRHPPRPRPNLTVAPDPYMAGAVSRSPDPTAGPQIGAPEQQQATVGQTSSAPLLTPFPNSGNHPHQQYQMTQNALGHWVCSPLSPGGPHGPANAMNLVSALTELGGRNVIELRGDPSGWMPELPEKRATSVMSGVEGGGTPTVHSGSTGGLGGSPWPSSGVGFSPRDMI